MHESTNGNAIAEKNHEIIRKSLTRPESAGFAKHVLSNLGFVNLTTPAGLDLGEAPAFRVEAIRINRVAERIIKALFFREKDIPVPVGYEVTCRPMIGKMDKILEIFPLHKFKPWTTVGDKVFAYTYAETSEDDFSCVWYLMFYESVPFVGFTVKPKTMR